MPHSLQTLPKQIVDKIIEHCYDRQLPAFHPKFFRVYTEFDEYTRLCRRLRDSALPYLTRRLIFERYNLAVEGVGKQSLAHEELKAAKKLPPVIRWMTNMPRIIAAHSTSQVTEVVISTYDRYPDPDDILAMLREHKFDQYKWPSVTTLCVNFKSDYDIDDAGGGGEKDEAGAGGSSDWIPDESFALLSAFLAEHLPAVDTLWMDDNRCRRVGPRNALSNYVADRLSRLRRLNLRFAYMPAFGVKTLPPQITHLTLSVHSAYDYIDIPRVMTPMLVSLTLSAIPLSYLWDRFCHSTSVARSTATGQIQSTVEFTELRRLDLTFHVPYRSVPSGKTEDDLMWERYHKENTAANGDANGYDDDDDDSKDAALDVAAAAATTDDAGKAAMAKYVTTTTTSYKGNPKLKTISVKERTAKYTVLRSDGKR
ncbi:hypothetical protein GGF42_009097, partial [Coemansia sp. RSA 2424]